MLIATMKENKLELTKKEIELIEKCAKIVNGYGYNFRHTDDGADMFWKCAEEIRDLRRAK
jgi:hypothetical protein